MAAKSASSPTTRCRTGSLRATSGPPCADGSRGGASVVALHLPGQPAAAGTCEHERHAEDVADGDARATGVRRAHDGCETEHDEDRAEQQRDAVAVAHRGLVGFGTARAAPR